MRSQVSRFALMAFGDLFANLKKFMDVDLDIAVKAILQKNSESNEFIRYVVLLLESLLTLTNHLHNFIGYSFFFLISTYRSDVEKCLEKMINNVTTHKGLIALINGGASYAFNLC